MNRWRKKSIKLKYLLKGIHGGSFGDMDTIVAIWASFTPPIQNNKSYSLILRKLRMIRQFPRESRTPHRSSIKSPLKNKNKNQIPIKNNITPKWIEINTEYTTKSIQKKWWIESITYEESRSSSSESKWQQGEEKSTTQLLFSRTRPTLIQSNAIYKERSVDWKWKMLKKREKDAF